MKKIKYFFEFIIISFLFILYKILGLKTASFLSGKLFEIFGPLFRSQETITSNIQKAIPQIELLELNKIKKSMWNNYGRVLAEYMFLKGFRNNKLASNINLEGEEILKKIRYENTPVIFISGHFSNFELMAMQIDKRGIDLAAVYRPLNNIFLNIVMERIRKRYICKNQIKKGTLGVRQLLKFFKTGHSIALMIDQRVSQGIKSLLFKNAALTTTIPAQFVKKFNCKIVPIYIERKSDESFMLEVMQPINFDNGKTIENITLKLNQLLEKMIIRNPHQWIWSHNRWK